MAKGASEQSCHDVSFAQVGLPIRASLPFDPIINLSRQLIEQQQFPFLAPLDLSKTRVPSLLRTSSQPPLRIIVQAIETIGYNRIGFL